MPLFCTVNSVADTVLKNWFKCLNKPKDKGTFANICLDFIIILYAGMQSLI